MMRLLITLLVLGCAETDVPDEDDTGDSGGDGGLGDSVPFTVIVEGYNSDGHTLCGLERPKELRCGEDDLVVLTATSTTELDDLFTAHVHKKAPDVDLVDEIALLSYLAVCPSMDERLRVDAVGLADTDLTLDELHVVPDGGQVEACLYNVITIPAVAFDTITSTLTVVGDD